jgi:hypothetical protein
MEKEFVPYELALALKELGFDEPCFGAWVNNELFITENEKPKIQSLSINQCTAPLYQQAFRWFREKRDLEYSIKKEYSTKKYFYTIRKDGIVIDGTTPYDIANNYEEAELECLRKLIEIVKDK